MKKETFICLSLFLACGMTTAQSKMPVSKNLAWLLRVLDQKDFVDEHLPTSENEQLLYRAFAENAFGNAAASNHYIREIRKNKLVNKGDSLDFYLHVTESDNDVKLYDYRAAQAKSRLLTKEYRNFYTEKGLKDEEESGDIFKFLSNEKPQTITKPTDTKLSLQKDMAGLWRIPVTMNDTTVDFVFDTGAGMSTIIRSHAQKMGVRLIDNAFVKIRSGVTGIDNQVQLGMAPKLQLGNITVKNVVFLVFPDEAFRFANGAYVIQGILGLPVIRALDEFSIAQNEIFIPKNLTLQKVKPNMILDLLKPVLYMNYEGKNLPFTFDSGADGSNFSDNFYNAYRQEIDSLAQKQEVTVGGAGGTVNMEVMVMPQLVFKVNDRTAVFKQAQVSTREISTTGEVYYGNVGQDLIQQFSKMTISFKGSYILFE